MQGIDNDSRAAALRPQIESFTDTLRAAEAGLLAAVIDYTAASLHKECDGFSGIRDWIKESFNLNEACAGQIASIARLAPKFQHLVNAALAGTARIDAIAYAMRRLESEGLTAHARIAYPAPVASPYDQTPCATPEALIREYCIHATRSELAEHLDRIGAELFDAQAMLDDLSQQSLAWLEINRRPDGMWDLEGLLTDDTGKLLNNALRTAVPAPREADKDADGLLPRVSGRNAEALHQMIAAYGTAPDAPRRHGHTATLHLTCDLATLRGEATGRPPMLEGKPIAVSKARFLACEAGVIPSIFDYTTGEAIELGRAKRLPNTALRHKLELEQPAGCAWAGCRAPIAWTEAHHLQHWADGGATDATNLILLCRFHHGRIHTGKWEITKTAPGQASIRHIRTGATDTEWEADPDLPTGQATEEFSRTLKRQLDDYAAWFAQKQMAASINRTRERFREADQTEAKARNTIEAPPAARAAEPATVQARPATAMVLRQDPGDPPFLPCPQRATAEGSAGQPQRSPTPERGTGPLGMSRNEPTPKHPPETTPAHHPKHAPRPTTTLPSPTKRPAPTPTREAEAKPRPTRHLVVTAKDPRPGSAESRNASEPRLPHRSSSAPMSIQNLTSLTGRWARLLRR